MVCPRTAFMKLLVAMACLLPAPVTLASSPLCSPADCVAPCLGLVLDDVTSRLAALEAENAVLKEHIDDLRGNITSSWSDEVAQAVCTALDAMAAGRTPSDVFVVGPVHAPALRSAQTRPWPTLMDRLADCGASTACTCTRPRTPWPVA